MRPISLAGVSALLLALIGAGASAATITLNPAGFTSNLYSEAVHDDILFANGHFLNPTALPFNDTQSQAVGDASIEITYNLSGTQFEILLDHNLSADIESRAFSTVHLYFTVDADVDYDLQGTYAALDDEGRLITLAAGLYDHSTSSFLFANQQDSVSTANEVFTLGLQEGDQFNGLVGSLTGTLVAGRVYELSYGAGLYSNQTGATSPASGSGFLQLTIVPEPSTALLLCAGLGFLGVVGRRRAQ